tara:strand:+ start:33717 stop:35645 length:1929 start_codon:yes stop_codon:yes gene_type:complete
MKTSKFVQLDPKVLMEYIYEDSFLTSENYIVTHNLTEDMRSFAPKDNIGSNNRYSNQLVSLDPVLNKYGIRSSENYNFLQDREYTQNLPLKYDRVKLHFPIDFSFDDYVGCYLRVFVMDYDNTNLINLSSYYFDKQNQDRFNSELQLSSPPNTLNGRLWGKYIEIAYPAPSVISLQRTNNIANSNSINYNISGGIGISNTAPVMMEFGYITKKDEINNIITYLLRAPYQTSVPQTPDYENLSITIEPNSDGDWFDIYGTYNGTSAEFNTWIQLEKKSGKSYYVEYVITMFEENIKGKSMNIVINSDFNEKVEYRPIVKYSSTTSAIEVVMRVIDKVDSSIITRRSSYGLLPDEISKYSRSLVRINVDGTKTPKIYNLRSGGSMFDAFDGLNNRKFNLDIFGDDIQTVKVPYPLLVNMNSILAKTESAVVGGTIWRGFGKLKIIVDPFDNIFKFTLAKDVRTVTYQKPSAPTTTSTTPTASSLSESSFSTVSDTNTNTNSRLASPIQNNTGGTYNKVIIDYFNLLNAGTINLYFKDHSRSIITSLYRKTGEIDLKNGTVVFKLDKGKVNDVRQIYESGINMFYITSTNEETDETTVIYEGTFIMSDSIDYVEEMSDIFSSENADVEIIRDDQKETAIVTRRSI